MLVPSSIPTVDEVTPRLPQRVWAPWQVGGTGIESEVLEACWPISIGEDVNAVDANGETAMHGRLQNLPKVVISWPIAALVSMSGINPTNTDGHPR